MVAPCFEEAGELAQDRDALMRLQPVVAILEDGLRRLQLAFECGFVVGLDLGDRGAVIGLHNPEHGRLLEFAERAGDQARSTSGTLFLSSSTRTRVFSE